MRFPRADVVLFLAVCLAACSGGGGSSPAPHVTAPTATPTPTAAPSSSPNATPSPVPTVTPAGSVTIEVSQSTNTNAYTIVLQTNATAMFSQDGDNQTTTISTTDTNQFFTDLNANVPVSSVATSTNCPKSASFGTTTTLVYQGSTSGDISCPNSTAAQTLYSDAQKIESDVGAKVGGLTH